MARPASESIAFSSKPEAVEETPGVLPTLLGVETVIETAPAGPCSLIFWRQLISAGYIFIVGLIIHSQHVAKSQLHLRVPKLSMCLSRRRWLSFSILSHKESTLSKFSSPVILCSIFTLSNQSHLPRPMLPLCGPLEPGHVRTAAQDVMN